MKTQHKKKLAVFDFDGTLVFTDPALIKHALKLTGKMMSKKEIRALPHEIKTPIYEAANLDVDMFAPNKWLIDKLNKMHDEGYKIVILTARHETSKAGTTESLRREKVNYDELYHDPALVRMPDEEFKAIKLAEITKDYDDVEIYEDKQENVDFLKEKLGSRKFSYFLVEKDKFTKI